MRGLALLWLFIASTAAWADNTVWLDVHQMPSDPGDLQDWMESLTAHTDLVGLTVAVRWSELETERGTIDFLSLEELFLGWEAARAESPALDPLLYILRFDPYGYPCWLVEDDPEDPTWIPATKVKESPTDDDTCDPLDDPDDRIFNARVWTPRFTDRRDSFLTELSTQLAGWRTLALTDPDYEFSNRIWAVWIGGGKLGYPNAEGGVHFADAYELDSKFYPIDPATADPDGPAFSPTVWSDYVLATQNTAAAIDPWMSTTAPNRLKEPKTEGDSLASWIHAPGAVRRKM